MSNLTVIKIVRLKEGREYPKNKTDEVKTTNYKIYID
jgi:hypothetical protein